MYFWQKSILAVSILALSSGASFSEETACERDGFKLLYEATDIKGTFEYWEQSTGSPHSDVLIFHYDTDGNAKWVATAERRCSQGVGRCWLMLDFALDGSPSADPMRIEMNYFAIGEQRYIVFSHMLEGIIYSYFKNHPFSKFNLVPPNLEIDPNLSGEDYEIPNLFKAVC